MKKTSKRDADNAKRTTMGKIARYLPITPPSINRSGKNAAILVETDASTGARTSRLPARQASTGE